MRVFAIVAAVLALAAAGAWYAVSRAAPRQSAPPAGGPVVGTCASDSAFCSLYDPAAVLTVSGKLETLATDIPGMPRLVRAVLATAEGRIPVLLAPTFHLDAQPVRLRAGDEVRVTGARMEFEGRKSIVAARVERGRETLVLRDERGKALWKKPGGGGPETTEPR